MAEMVGSIVVGEVVSRTSSFLIGRHRDRLSAREGVERLEMAHIRMEAALEVSARWRAADAPLLRWRRRLRRAAGECDAALHRWKLRELQEEAARERLARAPLPGRVAHAILCFVSALLALARRRGGGWDDASRARAAVERFERLADGAAEFLRCVEFNAAPRKRRLLIGPAVGELGGGVERGMLRGAGARHCFLGAAGSESPAEVWMGSSKPWRGYGKRRASGTKLLLV
ncbi:hypothetical protein PAHAL_9G420800 [Panicum hallii]|jgi:hypothetical protein|uniref:Rx N-terminal domain-containing protein n=1 Tax=Panicum hallii TaxID=206008 RepID=A0A2S3IPI1_9POAL|nr:uncharacterized protein LOC112876133 [Panicum hallii]PAN49026.1 hypothetical protein PAHAL_9G420800 [Panicum hallii]